MEHESTDAINSNAFKEAEKRFQLHQLGHVSRRMQSKANRGGSQDLNCVSGIADARNNSNGASSTAINEILVSDVSRSTEIGHLIHPLASCFSVSECPGCILFPGALTLTAQLRLAVDAFTRFIEPPATTNHSAIYGPVHKLLHAAQKDQVMQSRSDNSKSSTDDHSHETYNADVSNGMRWEWVESNSSHRDKRGNFAPGTISAKRLLKRLRWCSIGPQYDWTARSYQRFQSWREIPSYLKNLAKYFSSLATSSLTSHRAGATGAGVRNDSTDGFQPDAALVNFYWKGDTLNGHKDDVEDDISQPIVVMSVGCDAVFLIGGESKMQEPVPLLLHSGDVIVMTSSARLCYHGVPRVFPGKSILSHNESAVKQLSEWSEKDTASDIFQLLQECRVSLSVRHTEPRKSLREAS